MTKDIFVIPDVHGRPFWSKVCTEHPDADTIFLGDYVDPYPNEGVTKAAALENFEKIIGHARTHPNVTLLLGNHDVHYFSMMKYSCRMDYERTDIINELFVSNIDLFKVVALRKVNGKMFVFSHAPILSAWVAEVGGPGTLEDVAAWLNGMMKDGEGLKQLGKVLDYCTSLRGGVEICSSPVWADLREVTPNKIISGADYSVFGHTLIKKPLITDKLACLDTRRAFRITPDGKILKAL